MKLTCFKIIWNAALWRGVIKNLLNSRIYVKLGGFQGQSSSKVCVKAVRVRNRNKLLNQESAGKSSGALALFLFV